MPSPAKHGSMIWVDIVALLMVLCSFAVLFLRYDTKDPSVTQDFYDMTNGWLTPDGKKYALNQLPPGNVTLTHTLNGIETAGRSFCLKSADTFLDISFDGSNAYHYAPVYPPLFGRSYGLYIHTIPVPEGASQVTVVLEPVYNGYIPDVRAVTIMDPVRFLRSIFRSSIPELFLSLTLVVLSILMLTLGLSNIRFDPDAAMGMFSLAMFSLIAGIWWINDTFICQILTQHPEVIRLVAYLCIMFVPYPPVSFMASVANRRNSRVLSLISLLIAANFIATTFVSVHGICDPYYMRIFSHINIIAAMCIIVRLMICAIRSKNLVRRLQSPLIVGIAVAMVGAGIDMIRFWYGSNIEYGASPFTRVGIVAFIVGEGLYLARDQYRLVAERERSSLVEKLAYLDALTGLANRAAFHEKESALRTSEKPCIFILLDINYLKKVNDEFGHIEGDRQIIAAAQVIHECLSDAGSCYRIGGDEFAAVLDTEDAQDTERRLSQIEERAAAYNKAEQPPVPLQIAYGYSLFMPPTVSLETAENMADKRMYEKKKLMKTVEMC